MATSGCALSAREAFVTASQKARDRAPDAELESVSSSNFIFLRDHSQSACPAVGNDGRLRPEGSWGFKFVSHRLNQHCAYDIPHTGRVWWNFYPVVQDVIPNYGAVLAADDWIDSTVVAPRAFNAIQQQLGTFHVFDIFFHLRAPWRYSGGFVWEACCIAYGPSMSERRDITVQFDRATAQVLEVTTR